jgi:hypothetical protein
MYRFVEVFPRERILRSSSGWIEGGRGFPKIGEDAKPRNAGCDERLYNGSRVEAR